MPLRLWTFGGATAGKVRRLRHIQIVPKQSAFGINQREHWLDAHAVLGFASHTLSFHVKMAEHTRMESFPPALPLKQLGKFCRFGESAMASFVTPSLLIP